MRTVLGVLPLISSLAILSLAACVGDDTSTPTDAGANADGATTSDGGVPNDGSSPIDSSTPTDAGTVDAGDPRCLAIAFPPSTELAFRACTVTAPVDGWTDSAHGVFASGAAELSTLGGKPALSFVLPTSAATPVSAFRVAASEPRGRVFGGDFCVVVVGSFETPDYNQHNYNNASLVGRATDLGDLASPGFRLVSALKPTPSNGLGDGLGVALDAKTTSVVAAPGSKQIVMMAERRGPSLTFRAGGVTGVPATIAAGSDFSAENAPVTIGGSTGVDGYFTGKLSEVAVLRAPAVGDCGKLADSFRAAYGL